MILGVSAFNENIAILFLGSSVRLISNRDFKPNYAGERDFIKSMNLFNLYEINKIYYELDSISSMQSDFELSNKIEAKPLTHQEILTLFNESKHRVML